MIVRMAKIEVIGPKSLLDSVMGLIREMGLTQIEPSPCGFIEKEEERCITAFLPDEKTLRERFFLEDMLKRIKELLRVLPEIRPEKGMLSAIESGQFLEDISKVLSWSHTRAGELVAKKAGLKAEFEELKRYEEFLTAMASLLPHMKASPDVDFIGVTVKDASEIMLHLRALLSRLTEDRFEITTEGLEDGTSACLISIPKAYSQAVRKALYSERVMELRLPEFLAEKPFPEAVEIYSRRLMDIQREVEEADNELMRISTRWRPTFGACMRWIEERLLLISATSYVFETKRTFIICGWMPDEYVETLRERLDSEFSKSVVLEKKEIREEDMGRVPVTLKNPAYFQPFELFTRLLPLPKYTSYDPTVFVGIFFPVFFGMIFGDAGYGLILIAVAVFLYLKYRARRVISDASKILFISSINSIFFGVLYGEFFGDLGNKLFGMEPIYLERREAIIPLLFFALAVGLVHVIIGLLFGVVSAMRKKAASEAVAKGLYIVLVICIIILIASLAGIFPEFFSRPLLIVILILSPFLLFTGGLLAPLELLKTIGNIISYARIMAIGLTSVFLAFVANRIGGITGDIIVGILVGGLLHLINIVLGVFSPTIHSLRLHYVEFFSKFLEPGGRRYEPLSPKSTNTNVRS